MKTKIVGAATGVAALVALATVLPAAGSSSSVSIEEMVPAFATQQAGSDRAPATLNLESLGGISADSLRLVGSDEAGRYWVGRGETSDVCLIMQLAVDEEMAASTCAPIAEFYRVGLKLMAGKSEDEPATSAEAYLFPADIDLRGDVSPAARSARSAGKANLISGNPDVLDKLEDFEVRREDGTVFRFSPLFRSDK